ncbi:MAG: hypothetical protein WEC75_01160 [Dehalococcoidia bacterium]
MEIVERADDIEATVVEAGCDRSERRTGSHAHDEALTRNRACARGIGDNSRNEGEGESERCQQRSSQVHVNRRKRLKA